MVMATYGEVPIDEFPACYTAVPIYVKLVDESDYTLPHMVVGVSAKKLKKVYELGIRRPWKM
jgi:hypothetical protein